MPSPTQFVRDQIFAAIASGAPTKGFDNRRVSEIRKRCFGVSKNKVISRTNEIERATAKLIALNLNPSEELINTALGWTGVSIPANRISEGKTWAKLINRGTEVLVNLGQERLETLSKEWGPLIAQPFGKTRHQYKKRVIGRTGVNPETTAKEREDRLYLMAQTLRPSATWGRYTDAGSEAVGADFIATENGIQYFYDAKGWRNFTMNEFATIVANSGRYYMLTDTGYILVERENLRPNLFWTHAPVRRN